MVEKCSPPGKIFKVFMKACPQCGSGPYMRPYNEHRFCTDECRSRFIRRSKEKKRNFKYNARREMRKQKREKEAKRINTLVQEKLNSILKSEKKSRDKHESRSRMLEKKYGKSFYTSREWQEIRYKVFKRDGKQCAICGNSKRLHIDHIKPRSKHPELEFELDNLQVLCEDCNLGKGNSDNIDWRKI